MPSIDVSAPARRAIVRDAIGIGVATGAFGLSYGAIAVASGLSVIQTVALSLLMFTGASQFALAGVVGAGGGAFASAATAVLLGTRNALYGLQLSALLRARGPRRLLAAHLVIDESAAMAVAQHDPPRARVGFWATGVSVFVLWNLGSLIGAVGAGLLEDPNRFGLDVAGPAAFVALLAPRLRDRPTWIVAVLAAIAAIASVPFVPAGMPVLVAAGIAAVATFTRPATDPPAPEPPVADPPAHEPEAG
ncbi:MAG: AzlC family ABC transporter permease [Actinobacteria bacterium]|jgi:predicted branched-subunit amino acid permease|nr:AzlC family ABC transporter permease [Actinomycetota bacterium]